VRSKLAIVVRVWKTTSVAGLIFYNAVFVHTHRQIYYKPESMKGHFGVNNQSGGNGDCNEEGGHPSKVSYGSTIATEAFYDEN
jgi:hypothetical protein